MISNRKNAIYTTTKLTEILLSIPEVDISNCSENDAQFDVSVFPESVNSLERIFNSLAPFAEVASLSIEVRIQQGIFIMEMTSESELTIIQEWRDDPDLYFPEIPQEGLGLIEEIALLTNYINKKIDSCLIFKLLSQGEKQGVKIDLSGKIYLDKGIIYNKLNEKDFLKIIFYIYTDKFYDILVDASLENIDQIFTPNKEHVIIILLGDFKGYSHGPNIYIWGIDNWSNILSIDFDFIQKNRDKIISAYNFSSIECRWDITFSGLTPYHLYINENNKSNKIVSVINKHLIYLCVIYLANQTQFTNSNYKCSFFGYKNTEVFLNGETADEIPSALYLLFSWGYENSSSDKITIIRQIITLQLMDFPEHNLQTLLENSEIILSSAKNNFHYYLKRNVELFFEKRQILTDHINKLSAEVSAQIKEQGVELQNNIFKAISIIIAVVIYAILSPNTTAYVIYLASVLYTIYIGYILFLFLPFSYIQFASIYKEYFNQEQGFQEILLQEEISRIEGKILKRSRIIFLTSFFIVNFAYAALGLVSLITSIYIKSWI